MNMNQVLPCSWRVQHIGLLDTRAGLQLLNYAYGRTINRTLFVRRSGSSVSKLTILAVHRCQPTGRYLE